MSGIVDKNEVLDSNMDTKKDSDEYVKKVEQSLRKTFKKRIWSKFTKAINTYELVKPGDKIAVYFRWQRFYGYGEMFSRIETSQ